MSTNSFSPSPDEAQAASPSILQVGALPPDAEEAVNNEFQVMRLGENPREFLELYGSGVTIALTSAITGVKKDVIDMLPDLRAIINYGVGYDSTDWALASERGIAVSNTPDVLTDCVADIAVGLTIDVLRRMSAADRFVRAGSWPTASFPLSSRVTGKRIGIIGLGRIGRAIARRFEGFDTPIAYHNRKPIAGEPYEYVASIKQLAHQSDILIVAVSAGPGTEALVSRDVLDALGPVGYLINVARGSVVDEKALTDALRSGAIAGAGLDVFVAEPHVSEELRSLENVVLLPHIGSATRETRHAMTGLFLQNLRQFLSNRTLTTPIP